MPNPNELTAAQAAHAVAKRSITATELAEACLNRIESLDAGLKAWVYVDREAVLAEARAADQGPYRRAARWARCTVFRSASRTFTTRQTSPREPAARCTRTSFPNSTPRR